MSFQIGPAHVVGIVLGIIALRRTKATELRRFGVWAVVTTALALLMTLSISRPVWEAIGTLRYVQFPWRFLMPAAVGASALVAVAVDAWSPRATIAACALVPPVLTGAFAAATGNRFYLVVLGFQILLGALAWLLRRRGAIVLAALFIGLALPWSAVPLHARLKHEPAVIPLHEADLRPERVRLGVRRTTARDDYLPRTVGEKTIPPRDAAHEYLPPEGATLPPDVEVRLGSVEVGPVARDGSGMRFRVLAPDGGIVALELHEFPGWAIRIVSADRKSREELVPGRDDAGRIVLSIPPGTFDVRALWTETPSRRFWDVVSFVALLAVTGLTLRAERGWP